MNKQPTPPQEPKPESQASKDFQTTFVPGKGGR